MGDGLVRCSDDGWYILFVVVGTVCVCDWFDGVVNDEFDGVSR